MTLEEMNELKNYYTIPKKKKEKKKRALLHGQSVCDENFIFIFMSSIFLFLKKKMQNKQEMQ